MEPVAPLRGQPVGREARDSREARQPGSVQGVRPQNAPAPASQRQSKLSVWHFVLHYEGDNDSHI